MREGRSLNLTREQILKLAREIGNNLHERVWRYAIKKLAQQLFDCIECEQPRTETDWLKAENFLLQQSDPALSANGLVLNYVLAKVGMQQGRLIHEATFDEDAIRIALADDSLMDECLGQLIWNAGYQKIKYILPRPPYGEILC